MTLELTRKSLVNLIGLINGKKDRVFSVEDKMINTDDYQTEVRIYKPSDLKNLPLLVYFHGGGFVLGDIKTVDNICRTLCLNLDCIVVSGNYRLSPEYKFPSALNDAQEILKWSVKFHRDCGHINDRLIVAGDSAGGNLASVLALKSASLGLKITHQLLFYPWVDLSDTNSKSFQMFRSGYILTKDDILWFRDCYLNRLNESFFEEISPALSPNIAKMPPAIICTSEFDVLRDQGEAFYERLKSAGIPCVHIRFDGQIHGCLSMTRWFRKKISLYMDQIKTAVTEL